MVFIRKRLFKSRSVKSLKMFRSFIKLWIHILKIFFSKKETSSSSHAQQSPSLANFATLPDELQLEILGYVSISDLCNFCEAFKSFKHLLQEKALTRNINLKAWYYLNTNRIFSNINPENVTSLNLNYCRWLPHEHLLNFVGKCANLETLLAFETKLELKESDVECYNKTKINKLAVTIKNQASIATTAVLDKVTSLALDVDCCCMFEVCTPKKFSRIFPSLQRIWVDHSYLKNRRWIYKWLQSYKSAGQLQELVYCGHEPDDIFISNIPAASNLYCSYKGRNVNLKPVTCYETAENVASERDRFFKSYGRKAAKILHWGEETLETIQFEKWNLYQTHTWPKRKNPELLQELLSPNARNIEKLTLCICVLDDNNAAYNHSCLLHDFWFFLNEKLKKSTNKLINIIRRNGTSLNNSCVLKVFNELRFLQLFNCAWPQNYRNRCRNLQEYNSLASLTKLRYLFVQIPKDSDGKFLADVLNKCPQLETLHINNMWNGDNANIRISRDIFKAFNHSANLKELILKDYFFLCIDHLLSILTQSKQIKLQKLLLSCTYSGPSEEIHDQCLRLSGRTLKAYNYLDVLDEYLRNKHPSIDYFSVDLLSKYMSSNCQLIDCQIYVRMLNKVQIALIELQMSSFKTSYRCFNIGSVEGAISQRASDKGAFARFNLIEEI